jgi:hypothetical protein
MRIEILRAEKPGGKSLVHDAISVVLDVAEDGPPAAAPTGGRRRARGLRRRKYLARGADELEKQTR